MTVLEKKSPMITISEHSMRVLEERNVVFRALYDTVVQCEGVGEQKAFEVITRNLLKICRADLCAVAVYLADARKLILKGVGSAGSLMELPEPCPSVFMHHDEMVQLEECSSEPCTRSAPLLCRHFKEYLSRAPNVPNPACYRLTSWGGDQVMVICMVQVRDRGRLKMKDLVQTYMGLVSMVAQRINTLRLLQEGEAKYRNVVERASDGIVLLREGLIQYVNPCAAALSGRSPAAMQGWPFTRLLREDDAEVFNTAYVNVLKNGQPHKPIEAVIPRDDGSRRVVEYVISSTLYSGHPVELIMIRDLTDRRQMQEQMSQMQRSESIWRLATGVAGELAIPLQQLEQLVDTQVTEDARHDVRRQLNRIREVVSALEAMQPTGPDKAALFEVEPMMRQAAILAAGEWRSRVDLQLEVAPGLPPVQGCATDFIQVLISLIVNAVDAIELDPDFAPSKKGVVVLAARLDAYQHVLLEVHDNGAGVPEESADRIFESGFTTRPHRHGLGLARVRWIIEQVHGTVSFAGRPGGGTVFTIRL